MPQGDVELNGACGAHEDGGQNPGEQGGDAIVIWRSLSTEYPLSITLLVCSAPWCRRLSRGGPVPQTASCIWMLRDFLKVSSLDLAPMQGWEFRDRAVMCPAWHPPVGKLSEWVISFKPLAGGTASPGGEGCSSESIQLMFSCRSWAEITESQRWGS